MIISPILLIILSAFSGFSIAVFIYFKKKKSAPLVCPIGHSCDPVVHSDYSRFMCVPVEIMGACYYFGILASYSLLYMYPSMEAETIKATLLVVSGIAFLFSAYLTAVQAFILKEWCTWCLFSAALCTIIFLTALKLSGTEMLGTMSEGLAVGYEPLRTHAP